MKNFFRNLFGTSIKSKVLAVVEKRIDNAQKLYDVEVTHLNKSTNNKLWAAFYEARDKMKAHRAEAKAKKAEMEQRHIDSILSKIL